MNEPEVIKRLNEVVKDLMRKGGSLNHVIELGKGELKELKVFAAERDEASLSHEYNNRKEWYAYIKSGGDAQYEGYHHTGTLPGLFKETPIYPLGGVTFYIKIV